MAGKFELYKDKSDKFRFRLKASNGQVIATGEACETKASALNGIESVKKNSAGATTDDRSLTRAEWPPPWRGQFRAPRHSRASRPDSGR